MDSCMPTGAGLRPYLDARIRSGSSSFWAIRNAEAGLQNLRRDLETGEWARHYAELFTLDEYDAGYRLVVADSFPEPSQHFDSRERNANLQSKEEGPL